MSGINVPTYSFKMKSGEGGKFIFDPVRKKYVALTPEEWVRQNFILYMHLEKRYPLSLTGVEVYLKIHGMSRRCDIVFYDNKGNPRVLVECKSPEVEIKQRAMDQVAVYNLGMKVDYLVVTNLVHTYACRMDYEKKAAVFLSEVPSYSSLVEGLSN